MSQYADIYIRKLSLCSFRNYLNSNIVSLFFSKEDLLVSDCMQDFEEDAPVEYTSYIYKTTVLKAIERLDALGYSIENFEKIFNANIMQAIDYSAFLSHLGVDFDDHDRADVIETSDKKVKKTVGW